MSNQPSLYIIEDDTKLREMLAEYMTNQGFQVTTFATGETAPNKFCLINLIWFCSILCYLAKMA